MNYSNRRNLRKKSRQKVVELREMNPKKRNPRESPFLRLLKYPRALFVFKTIFIIAKRERKREEGERERERESFIFLDISQYPFYKSRCTIRALSNRMEEYKQSSLLKSKKIFFIISKYAILHLSITSFRFSLKKK